MVEQELLTMVTDSLTCTPADWANTVPRQLPSVEKAADRENDDGDDESCNDCDDKC